MENLPWYEAIVWDTMTNKYLMGTLMGVGEGLHELPKVANLFGADYENPMTAEVDKLDESLKGLGEEGVSQPTREISRIVTQLAPVGALVQATSKIPLLATQLEKVPKTALAMKVALTDFLALSGDEPGLADAVDDAGALAPLLFTKKKEGEPEAIGRLKNSAEALFLLGGVGAAGKYMLSPAVRKIAETLNKGLSAEPVARLLKPISARLQEISPRLVNRLHAFELQGNLLKQKYVDSMEPFAELYKKMDANEQKLLQRFTSSSKTMPSAFRLLERLEKNKPELLGIKGAFQDVRASLDELHQLANKNGVEIQYRRDYIPRTMNYEKYLKEEFGKKRPNELQMLLNKYKDKKRDDLMTSMERSGSDARGLSMKVELSPFEEAEVIQRYAQGERVKKGSSFQGERKIEQIGVNNQKYYDDMLSGMQKYVNNVTHQITKNRFIGKAPGTEKDNIWTQIQMHAKDPDSREKAIDLINTRLAGGEQSIGKKLGAYRDFAYLATIGNPFATITQLGDIGLNSYRNGLINTVSPFGKKVKLKDFGLNDIAAEFTDPASTRKAVDYVFRKTGFKKLDQVLKQSNMNGALRQAQKQLKNKNSKEYKEFSKANFPFFKHETGDLINAIRAGNIDDENVKLFLFSRLSKTQPISLSEMPEMYLKSKGGRVAYALKSFTLKQLELVRSDILEKLSKKETMGEGMKNAARLGVLFGGVTGSTNVVKDLILGRPVDVPDAAMDALMTNAGITRHHIYKFKMGPIEGVSSIVAPPAPVIKEAVKVAFADDRGKALETQSQELPKYIPIGGKLYYWRLGAGAEKSREQRIRKIKGKD